MGRELALRHLAGGAGIVCLHKRVKSSSPAAHPCSVLLPHASVSPWDWTASIPWGCTVHGTWGHPREQSARVGTLQHHWQPAWCKSIFNLLGHLLGTGCVESDLPFPNPLCASTLGSMSHSYLSPHPCGDTCCPLKHHCGDRHGRSGALNHLLVACREGEAHLAWVWLGIR